MIWLKKVEKQRADTAYKAENESVDRHNAALPDKIV